MGCAVVGGRNRNGASCLPLLRLSPLHRWEGKGCGRRRAGLSLLSALRSSFLHSSGPFPLLARRPKCEYTRTRSLSIATQSHDVLSESRTDKPRMPVQTTTANKSLGKKCRQIQTTFGLVRQTYINPFKLLYLAAFGTHYLCFRCLICSAKIAHVRIQCT